MEAMTKLMVMVMSLLHTQHGCYFASFISKGTQMEKKTFLTGVIQKFQGSVGGGSAMTILSARLLFRPEGGIVAFSLNGEGTNVVSSADKHESEEVSFQWELPSHLFKSKDGFILPDELCTTLNARIERLEEPGASRPIWLRLIRPYGFLGLVPWERGIATSLVRAVLRLPEFPMRPVERTDVLENVLIVDPGTADPLDITPRVRTLVESILRNSTRTVTRVHIFASASWIKHMPDFKGLQMVSIYEPTEDELETDLLEASRNNQTDTDSIAPWIKWVVDTLSGRGIDALHWIGRANLSETGPKLLLRATPSNKIAIVPDIEITLDDACLLLNRMGAWSISLAPAAPQHAEPITSAADELGHRWSGAVVYLGHHTQLELGDIVAACRLLYAVDSTETPSLRASFVYCHPSFLLGKRVEVMAKQISSLANHSLLMAARAPAMQRVWGAVTRILPGISTAEQDSPPSWVGSTQRFIESKVFEEMRRSASDVFLSNEKSSDWDARKQVNFRPNTERVLNEVQTVIASYLSDSKKKGKTDA
jgi:hypothetical protein